MGILLINTLKYPKWEFVIFSCGYINTWDGFGEVNVMKICKQKFCSVTILFTK